MRNLYTLLAFLAIAATAQAQVQTKGVAIINGGMFGNNADNAHLIWYTPDDGNSQTLDTIQTQSVQDMITDGHLAYVAAQDSIILYNMATGSRMAANAFGGPSTISMALWEDYLIVGNWYAPFGWVGPYQNHLRIFDRQTLAYMDSIPEISQGAKDMAIIGDTLYVNQNLNSSAFSDSAGWMVKVHLPTMSYVDSVAVNGNQADFGRLLVKDGMLYSLNGASNTVTQYDPMTGTVSTDTANADISPSSYNDRWAWDENGTLYTYINGKIGTYDLVSRTVINDNLVDTSVLAFALDTLSDRIYLTQTDFFSYTGGQIWAADGSGRLDTLFTGTSPEGIQVLYNTLPIAQHDTAMTVAEVSVKVAILDNDIDPDPANTYSIRILTDATQGSTSVENDSLVYTPNASFTGLDSVQYEIADAWGDTDTAWVQMEVLVDVSLEALNAAGIAVFPNPSTGPLTLQHQTAQPFSVRLLSLQGQVIQTTEAVAGTLNWDLSHLAIGLYLIQIDHPAGRITTRWQKQ